MFIFITTKSVIYEFIVYLTERNNLSNFLGVIVIIIYVLLVYHYIYNTMVVKNLLANICIH